MNFVKSVPFEFEGKHYEVRVARTNEGLMVRAFLDNQAVNGYSYNVDETTNIDFKMIQGTFAHDHLVEMAISDVKNKMWENYLAAISST